MRPRLRAFPVIAVLLLERCIKKISTLQETLRLLCCCYMYVCMNVMLTGLMETKSLSLEAKANVRNSTDEGYFFRKT